MRTEPIPSSSLRGAKYRKNTKDSPRDSRVTHPQRFSTSSIEAGLRPAPAPAGPAPGVRLRLVELEGAGTWVIAVSPTCATGPASLRSVTG
jgi:hypothetical protein